MLTSEQQKKFQELRERRLQLQNAQDEGASGRKKRKKKGKKGRPPTSAPDEKNETESSPVPIRSPVRSASARVADAGKITTAGWRESERSPTTTAAPAPLARGQNPDVEAPGDGCGAILGTAPDISATESAGSGKKKRRKLRWGLEIKERWERKGNM